MFVMCITVKFVNGVANNKDCKRINNNHNIN